MIVALLLLQCDTTIIFSDRKTDRSAESCNFEVQFRDCNFFFLKKSWYINWQYMGKKKISINKHNVKF